MNRTPSSPVLNPLRELIEQRSGIVFDHDQEHVILSRLSPVARRYGFPSVQHLIAKLPSIPSHVRDEIITAIPNHETSFFRDVAQFDAMRNEILPELIRRNANARRLRIWSAACSTGQEPYSLAMLLDTHFPELQDWQVTILATDLSAEAVNTAAKGMFNQLQINRGLPARYLVRYFNKLDYSWELKPELRRRVTFQVANLLQRPALHETFDLVLLRNVLIYFSPSTKQTVLRNVHLAMRPNAFLFLGLGESPRRLTDLFEVKHCAKSVCYHALPPS